MIFIKYFCQRFKASSYEETVEKFADLLELIYTVLPLQDPSIGELEKVRLTKREKRGGFDKEYYLIEVVDD